MSRASIIREGGDLMEKDRLIINTQGAPAAVGPYAQGVRYGHLVFTAGQIPRDPATGRLISGDIREQTRVVLENLKAILTAGGSSLEQVLKVTVYMRDLGKFAQMNEVFEQYFGAHKPARTTVEVSALPLGVEIEMDAIAYVRS